MVKFGFVIASSRVTTTQNPVPGTHETGEDGALVKSKLAGTLAAAQFVPDSAACAVPGIRKTGARTATPAARATRNRRRAATRHNEAISGPSFQRLGWNSEHLSAFTAACYNRPIRSCFVIGYADSVL